ncbi:MAG TPA: hypothetical protein VGP04_07150 [Pseudonocardiaceae bacterium]|nr:hypothetical protein [Pseudonocardiaceae bacterium]
MTKDCTTPKPIHIIKLAHHFQRDIPPRYRQPYFGTTMILVPHRVPRRPGPPRAAGGHSGNVEFRWRPRSLR